MMFFNITDGKKNVTNFTDNPQQEQFELWVVTLTLNLVLMCVAIWLAITIGLYGFKTGKFQRQKRADFSGGLILKLLFLAALALLPRLVSTLIVAFVGFESGSEGDFECEIAVDVSIGAYYFALLPAYLFLWFRQRALYLQPSIERLYTTLIKVISWGCMIFLLTAGIGIVVIFVLPLAYQASPRGCILRDEEEENVTVFYILSVFLITGQLTLLSLFIYPLHVHRNVQVSDPAATMKNARKSSSALPPDRVTSVQTEEESVNLSPSRIQSRDSTSSNQQKKTCVYKQTQLQVPSKTQVKKQTKHKSQNTGKRLIRVMRRSVASAVVCISSDLIALGLVGFIFAAEFKSFTNTLFDVSLMVNIISLICSFDTYKKIFKAPCSGVSASKQSQATSSGGFSTNNKEDSKTRNSYYRNESRDLN